MITTVSSFKAPTLPKKLLAGYKQQLQEQQHLLALIRTTLPDPLKDHACHAIYSHTHVVIYTDTVAWASQLRFFAPTVLKQITQQSKYAQVDKVVIRLMTPSQQSATTQRQPLLPSEQTIKLLASARTVQQDVISRALTSLSNTLEKKLRKRKTY